MFSSKLSTALGHVVKKGFATSNKSLVRGCATSGKLVNVDINSESGIATVTMNRPPVNSLNLELLTDLVDAMESVKKNKCLGMILTSSSNTVFSAGLDIMEMYKPKEERLKQFWTTLQEAWIQLYGSGFPTAAAINGHSPAGGCLLAMSCEYRVMLPKFSIGLNETQLGIVAPTWFQATMKNTIPLRQAELALTQGRMFSTEQALQVGLVDEVATDKADAIARCEKFLETFRKIPREARMVTKQSFRRSAIEELENMRDQDTQLFVYAVSMPKTQQNLEGYLEKLKKK